MTLFEPLSSSTLFSLPSLRSEKTGDRNVFSLPGLKEVEPWFALPKLDEYAAGEDRMMTGLEDGAWWGLRKAGMGGDEVGKGKGKGTAQAAEVIVPVDPVQADTRDEVAVEERVERSEWTIMADRMGMEAEAGPSRPRAFKPIPTWDVMDEVDAQNPFASEGGRRTFEAINLISEPSVTLPKLRSQPRAAPTDPDELLHLMIRATLGTTTTESLKWDKRKGSYVWAGGTGRTEGLSRVASSGAVSDFLEIATSLRRLDELLDRQSKYPLTPTHHALFNAVSTYLSFIKNRLSAAIGESEQEAVSGWIKWKAALRDVRELLGVLLEIMGWPVSEPSSGSIPSRASALLSHLYSHLLAHFQTSSPGSPASQTVLCLAYLLQSSSAPFLCCLHAWVGLSDSPAETASGDPADQPWSDLGITRLPRKGPNVAAEDVRWEYEFSSKRMPAFIPKDVRRKLFESGRSLRLFREANGEHPLAGGSWGLEGSWGWGSDFNDVHAEVKAHLRRIEKETEGWRRSIRERSRPPSGSSGWKGSRIGKKQRKRIPADFFGAASSSSTLAGLSDPKADPSPPVGIDSNFSLVPNTTTNVERQLSDFLSLLNLTPGSQAPAQPASIWSSTPLDALHSFLTYHTTRPLLPDLYPTFPLFISHHLLAPLLAHAELVSAALVSLYLDDMGYLDHLDILYSFWLGGDVGFFERVSGALFGKEDQEVGHVAGMGRRARTRARMGLGAAGGDPGGGETGEEAGEWGIALGVGLSDRQRWPPGGAELAYALRTTLVDDLGGHTGAKRDGTAWEEVEDRVSFAIRPLPEDEGGVRAKWMDPQSIEALDFLYLAYSPPVAMSVILPRGILAKYQTIHNFLLRLCRVNAVVRSMYSDLHKPALDDTPGDAPKKSGVDIPRTKAQVRATHRLRPERRTILSAEPELEKTILRLRFGMSHFVSALMRYIVDSAIGVNFDRMRRRLERLKRKDRAGDTRPDMLDDDGYSDFAPQASNDVEEADGQEEDSGSIYQLKSVHSLVGYHHLTLDRIMRASLLSPAAGYDVAFKLLMRLFGLILDLGKVVKEVERRMLEPAQARERVMVIKKEWEEKERVFILAVERLSQKSDKRHGMVEGEGEDGARDMEVLDEGDGQSGHVSGLAELLSRLKLGYGDDAVRTGRWNEGI